MTKFVRIYDARRDKRRAEASQRTTLHTDGGLDLLNGALCYSPEWFAAIDTGLIRTHEVQGTISRVYMSGHNDFPEFEVTGANGVSRWERYGTETHILHLRFERFYKVGNDVRMAYVEHPWKNSDTILGPTAQIVLYVDAAITGGPK